MCSPVTPGLSLSQSDVRMRPARSSLAAAPGACRVRRPHGSRTNPVVEKNTLRGPLRVASPEATALEIVGYADRCGGLDNVASVIAELAETLDPRKLLAAATRGPIAWVQRAGYLLDLTGQHQLADALAAHVEKHAHVVAPLVRAEPKTGAERLDRWKLAINASVEPEL
jgi:predicted transcriptional regulator of viral defense system